jgi:hypothetical protein
MADEVPSQARFIGGLALGLGAFAILAAIIVLFAGLNAPQV